MRVFLIKHKGASIWQNMFFDRTVGFSGDDDNDIHLGILFFRKNDATTYLKTLKHKDLYEVVGATVDKSSTDNRKQR